MTLNVHTIAMVRRIPMVRGIPMMFRRPEREEVETRTAY